ncbi:MAG TPA: hypothetical protein G4N98_00950 [Thermoflexia bacterium]|nr:hypothetical protein [Thermoflexia bacterium]
MTMLFFLLFELILVSLLAGLLGYLIAKTKGALTLMSQIFVLNGFLLLVVWMVYQTGLLPIQHLAWNNWWWASNYLSVIGLLVEITLWTTPWSGAVWYLLNNEGDAASQQSSWSWNAFLNILLVMSTLTLCLVVGYLGNLNVSISILASGLVIYFIGLAGLGIFSLLFRSTAWWKIPALWSGFFMLLAVGYVAAGRWGLYFICLPTLGSIFAGWYFLSQQVLPVDDPAQRRLAFQGFLGFIFGRHYPFYVIGDWQKGEAAEKKVPAPTVPGNPFARLFSGPGIMLNDSNHLALMWDGYHPRICPPGLGFTRKYEELFAAVDLRPQLRGATVKAETSDGIVTQTYIFMPHRIDQGGEQVRLGYSYPYDPEAVKKAVYENAYVDHKWWRDEEGLAHEEVQRIPWHELIVMQGPEILKQIIAKYKCNELHYSRKDPNPRVAIAGAFVKGLRAEMRPLGINLIGGGISNITISEKVEAQRIENWKAKWRAKIELEVGAEEVATTLSLENIWAEAQLDVLQELIDILADSSVTKETAAFQLLSALHGNPPTMTNVQNNIPVFAWSLLRRGVGNE